MKPRLSIGMAVADDFDGVYFSIQALKMYHSEVMQDCELIVVDNRPRVAGGQQMIQSLLGNAAHGTKGVKYIPMEDKVGTSQSRNAIFDNATGDFAMCMDSHVMIKPGALKRLLDFYNDNPSTPNLYSGPLLYDNLYSCETHFDNVWRSEMYGIWGRAWACPCYREHPTNPFLFSPHEIGNTNTTEFWALEHEKRILTTCDQCGRELPQIPFNDSYQRLEQKGYLPADKFPDDFGSFEVPAMGLGLFTCRKDAWLGFNRNFRGFGGEEIYIHEKYRQAGFKNICLPFLRWVHRFGRSKGIPYRLTKYDKVRNYVIGFQELGWDLEPIHTHFVKSGAIPQTEWDFLVADPIKHELHVAHAKFDPNNPIPGEFAPVGQAQVPSVVANPSGQPLPPTEVLESTDAMLSWFTAKPRDLNEHLPKLAELTKQVSHVTEFTERRESTVGLFAGKPERLISYNTENDLVLNWLKEKHPWITIEPRRSVDVPQIEETDMLFLDSGHTMAQLLSELQAYAPYTKRWIVLHDTAVYGQRGPDGGPGMVAAMKEFLKVNPEWFVYFHTQQQYGLTVLGRRTEDKPAQEVYAWPLEKGPGTELKALIGSLGINPSPSCDCNAMAAQMDQWGVAGCREHFDEIVDRIKQNQARWGWQETLDENAKQEAGEAAPKSGWKLTDTVRAGWKAVTSGLAFKINPLDPIPSLVKMAINKAEQKEEAENKAKQIGDQR